jgi:hypothetical protein
MEHLDAFKGQGKPYEYQLFSALGHNTAFATSNEPVETAIRWMKALSRLQSQRKRS